MSLGVWPFEFSLFTAIAVSLAGTVCGVLSEYRRKPSNPKGYVTWSAFLTVLMGLHVEYFSAFLWIMFYLGRITGSLGM